MGFGETMAGGNAPRSRLCHQCDSCRCRECYSLGSVDRRVLHRPEETLDEDIPRCINTGEDVLDCLLGVMGDLLC